MKILRIDKQVEITEVTELSTEDELQDLQDLVGGYIERVPLSPGACMIVNEEGRPNGMQQNPIASLVARRQIYGPALIAGVVAGADGEEFADVPEEYIELLGLTQ